MQCHWALSLYTSRCKFGDDVSYWPRSVVEVQDRALALTSYHSITQIFSSDGPPAASQAAVHSRSVVVVLKYATMLLIVMWTSVLLGVPLHHLLPSAHSLNCRLPPIPDPGTLRVLVWTRLPLTKYWTPWSGWLSKRYSRKTSGLNWLSLRGLSNVASGIGWPSAARDGWDVKLMVLLTSELPGVTSSISISERSPW
jgi:hypothetical protein